MNSIDVGSAVTCGMCGKETKVSFITDRQGIQAYDLDCFHRNAYCEACGKLVKDASQVNPGDEISAKLARGEIRARVEGEN